jgi:hypothetical protein
VKLSQFYDLCDREWGQESRGDVRALSLTDASYEELRGDFTGSESSPISPAQIREMQAALSGLAGDPAWRGKVMVLPPGPLELVNPVTRSVVKVTDGADSDTAEVYSVPESRIVALP